MFPLKTSAPYAKSTSGLETLEYTPIKKLILISTPVSSFTSLTAAASTVSPRSTYPEGKLHLPNSGSIARLTNNNCSQLCTRTTTANLGSSNINLSQVLQ